MTADRSPTEFPAARRRAQRGVTLIGLLFWAIVIGAAALLGLKVLPTINEFLTIRRAVDKIAENSSASVPEIRTAFDRQKDVEYAIQSISGKDLEVTKENDKLVIKFSYQKEIELFGPAYLLLKYEGRSK